MATTVSVTTLGRAIVRVGDQAHEWRVAPQLHYIKVRPLYLYPICISQPRPELARTLGDGSMIACGTPFSIFNGKDQDRNQMPTLVP